MAVPSRKIRFSRKMTQEEVGEIVKKYCLDRMMLGLPYYKLRPNKDSGDWWVNTKCLECGHEAIQPVPKLVNFGLGCRRCVSLSNARKVTTTVEKRTIKRGRVPFNREMTPRKVAAIMRDYRPDRKMLESPYYKLRPHRTSGDWWVKTECRDCGHEATQKVPDLVNLNLGCAGCPRK